MYGRVLVYFHFHWHPSGAAVCNCIVCVIHKGIQLRRCQGVETQSHFPYQTMLPIGGLPPSLQEEGHLGDFLNFVEVRKDSLCTSSDPGSYSRNAG